MLGVIGSVLNAYNLPHCTKCGILTIHVTFYVRNVIRLLQVIPRITFLI